jgi:predicted O-methyltransferase YrrM
MSIPDRCLSYPDLPAGNHDTLRDRCFSLLKQVRRSERARELFVWLFKSLQRAGINVTPRHFYWPIPDLDELERRIWPLMSLDAVDMDLECQLRFLECILGQYSRELDFASAPMGTPYEYHFNNGLFESFDAEVAYLMMRHFKPRRVIEIGGGFTTRLMARAALRNSRDGSPCHIASIDPFPDAVLRNGFPGLADVISRPVQQVDLELFQSLDAGDILFIDSSHVVNVGGDVVFEYLEVLPKLRPGVIVHAHDIFFPADYPRTLVLEGLCFWSEQYLLQAFLSFNPSFEVLWASSALHMFQRNAVLQLFPAWRDSYTRMPRKKRQFIPTMDGRHVWPSSFWFRKKPARPEGVS